MVIDHHRQNRKDILNGNVIKLKEENLRWPLLVTRDVYKYEVLYLRNNNNNNGEWELHTIIQGESCVTISEFLRWLTKSIILSQFAYGLKFCLLEGTWSETNKVQHTFYAIISLLRKEN